MIWSWFSDPEEARLPASPETVELLGVLTARHLRIFISADGGREAVRRWIERLQRAAAGVPVVGSEFDVNWRDAVDHRLSLQFRGEDAPQDEYEQDARQRAVSTAFCNAWNDLVLGSPRVRLRLARRWLKLLSPTTNHE